MKTRFLPLRVVAVVALGVLAACGDLTGSNKIEGVYNLSHVAVTQGGTTTNRSAPAMLYEGTATLGGQTYTVRVEFLSGSITLMEQESRYTYVGTFRHSEANNRLRETTETVTETGTYTRTGRDITFTQNASSEIHIGAVGTLDNRTISVDVLAPRVNNVYTATFQR